MQSNRHILMARTEINQAASHIGAALLFLEKLDLHQFQLCAQFDELIEMRSELSNLIQEIGNADNPVG